MRGDILNKNNIDPIIIETISPANYDPNHDSVKKFFGAFTCSNRYKMPEEYNTERRSGPGPQAYSIDDNLVKQTRFNNLLVGGHAPKVSIAYVNNNPGPGTYENPFSIASTSI
jgi:Sperm-tail PG-rich repeat